jgi:REP element-mobilizing transposase RayT
MDRICKPRIRKRLPLEQYNYSSPGFYAVIINSKGGRYCFGQIKNNKVDLNHLGWLDKLCFRDIPDHFPNIRVDSFIIMPNHIHGIIHIPVVAADFWLLRRADRSKMLLSKIIHGFKSSVSQANNMAGYAVSFR